MELTSELPATRLTPGKGPATATGTVWWAAPQAGTCSSQKFNRRDFQGARTSPSPTLSPGVRPWQVCPAAGPVHALSVSKSELTSNVRISSASAALPWRHLTHPQAARATGAGDLVALSRRAGGGLCTVHSKRGSDAVCFGVLPACRMKVQGSTRRPSRPLLFPSPGGGLLHMRAKGWGPGTGAAGCAGVSAHSHTAHASPNSSGSWQ